MSSGVEFEADNFDYKRPQQSGGGLSPNQNNGSSYTNGDIPGFTGYLIRHGIAKSPEAAQGIMICILIVNIIITVIIIKKII